MDSPVVLSALFAGLAAILITRAIERFGGIVGGFLGSLPSTIIPAAIGISAKSPSPELFAAAMDITPVGMLLNAFFLLAWRTLPPAIPIANIRTKLIVMVSITLCVWSALAAGSVLGVDTLRNLGVSGLHIGTFATLSMIAIGIWACIRNPPAPRGKNRVSWFALTLRGTLAATAIGVCVLISKGDNATSSLLAGMVSVFPAIFLTTMVSLWWSQGESVPTGAVGPMMLGSSSVSCFALTVPRIANHVNIGWACTIAWILSVLLVTLPSTVWLTSRTKRS